MVDLGDFTRAAREAQKFLDEHRRTIDEARRVVESPAMQAMKTLHQDPMVKRLLADVECHDAFMRSVNHPLPDLRRAVGFDRGSELNEPFLAAQATIEACRARFTLPEASATARLLEELRSPGAEAIAGCASWAHETQAAMDAMRTPWLDAQHALRSVTAFAEIQGIGEMLARMPSFDDPLTAALRTDLGDWRDKITWPEPVFADLNARGAFYVGLGFDPSLTDFPAAAFRESTAIAGLRREPPPVVHMYGEPVPHVDDEDEEEALVRTNIAHDWLQRLEGHLRRFIDGQMTAAYGPDWPRHHLPNGLYERWMERRQAAAQAGRELRPLVAYADFNDYERVICKQDNWRRVFGGFFSRPESVRESFQRLHLIRLDTMHARPIGQEDEFLLYVEVRRLINVTAA